MDQELTGNAFRRFMRRRGLSRDQRSDDAHGSGYNSDHNAGVPSSSRDPHSSTHRNSSNARTGEQRGRHSISGDGSVRRHHSTFESSQPQSPRRRRPEGGEEPNKKQYRCEYCSAEFGRKHHKERHVANIHMHVSFL